MSSEVLILNQDYEPLNVASLPRAFRLVLGGKAEILAEGEPIRSASRSWTAPSATTRQVESQGDLCARQTRLPVLRSRGRLAHY